MYKNYPALIVLFIAASLRIPFLGYSDFYGDETKAFYLRKDLSPFEFLLTQRKGPLQYLITWFVESVVGRYDELLLRIPFAFFGTAAVLVLYLLVKELFENKSIALISSYLFAVNGIFVAFSRTIQYQALLYFLGFLAIYFLLLFIKSKKTYLLILGACSLGLTLLSHYDGIFFIIPALGALIKNKVQLKNTIIFLTFSFLIAGLFYLPYLIQGNYSLDLVEYLKQRQSGELLLPHSTFVTFKLYNPTNFWFALLVFLPFFVFNKKVTNKIMLLTWFLVPFVIFEMVMKNPVTHIQMYLIPLIIMTSYGIVNFASKITTKPLKFLYNFVLGTVFVVLFAVSLIIFTPFTNKKYPWYDLDLLGLNIKAVDKNAYQLFIYGFPYNRGWRETRELFFSEKLSEPPRNFATNDNDTVGVFYLAQLFNYNGKPQYYIVVPDSQEQQPVKSQVYEDYYYLKETSYVSDAGYTIDIYRRRPHR